MAILDFATNFSQIKICIVPIFAGFVWMIMLTLRIRWSNIVPIIDIYWPTIMPSLYGITSKGQYRYMAQLQLLNVEAYMLHFWWIVYHCLHWKLSKWLPVINI